MGRIQTTEAHFGTSSNIHFADNISPPYAHKPYTGLTCMCVREREVGNIWGRQMEEGERFYKKRERMYKGFMVKGGKR